jgi:hypothetical protein
MFGLLGALWCLASGLFRVKRAVLMLRWARAVLKKGFVSRAEGHISGIQEGLGKITVDVPTALCFCSSALLAGTFEEKPFEGVGSYVGELCLDESSLGKDSGVAKDSWLRQGPLIDGVGATTKVLNSLGELLETLRKGSGVQGRASRLAFHLRGSCRPGPMSEEGPRRERQIMLGPFTAALELLPPSRFDDGPEGMWTSAARREREGLSRRAGLGAVGFALGIILLGTAVLELIAGRQLSGTSSVQFTHFCGEPRSAGPGAGVLAVLEGVLRAQRSSWRHPVVEEQ